MLVIASLLVMTLDHRQHHLNTIRAVIGMAVYPLQYLVDLPFSIIDWASEVMATRNHLINENRHLRQTQLEHAYRLQKFEVLERENERLRAMLQSTSRTWERMLVAELLAVDLDPFKHQIVINKGSNDGVFTGHPLLDAHGVIGQVISTNLLSSTVMLITDPSHAIPVQANRTGMRAIALGTGVTDRLELSHIPNNTDLKAGDLLITSGLGQRFPPGYPVATISLIEQDPGQPYARVLATPAAEVERSREALLVWPPQGRRP